MFIHLRTCGLLVLWVTASGCFMSHKWEVEDQKTKYNDALQRAAREEMLRNIVRMKYRDSIQFVSIPSITGQYKFSGSAGLSFPFSGVPGEGSADISAESRPTWVFQPEQGQEFYSRLQSRIAPETLDLLTSKGHAVDRVLRLTVRTMNDVDNATSAGGPTPKDKPEFERFRFIVDQMRELQRRRQLELAYESMVVDEPVQVADPISADRVGGKVVLAAAKEGYRFRPAKDGKMMTLWTQPEATNVLVLRVAPEAIKSPKMQQITEHLELEPERDFYPFLLNTLGQLEKPSASRSTERPVTSREEISVNTRSIMEMMAYLSHAIDVPDSHIERQLVTRTFDGFGHEFDWDDMTCDLLSVKVARFKPHNAAVSVKYRGHWFYIEDCDQSSKATFNLLIELFNLKVRAGGGAQIPLLTI